MLRSQNAQAAATWQNKHCQMNAMICNLGARALLLMRGLASALEPLRTSCRAPTFA